MSDREQVDEYAAALMAATEARAVYEAERLKWERLSLERADALLVLHREWEEARDRKDIAIARLRQMWAEEQPR